MKLLAAALCGRYQTKPNFLPCQKSLIGWKSDRLSILPLSARSIRYSRIPIQSIWCIKGRLTSIWSIEHNKGLINIEWDFFSWIVISREKASKQAWSIFNAMRFTILWWFHYNESSHAELSSFFAVFGEISWALVTQRRTLLTRIPLALKINSIGKFEMRLINQIGANYFE